MAAATRQATGHWVQRAHVRFAIAMDATVDGEPARTHDLSEAGMLVQAQCRPPTGSIVWVAVAFHAAGRAQRLGCYARVLRVQAAGDDCNIALQLTKPLFG
jgi:hypothetical protein